MGNGRGMKVEKNHRFLIDSNAILLTRMKSSSGLLYLKQEIISKFANKLKMQSLSVC